MLTALDIMTGKILVQLQLANVDDVRAELRELSIGLGDPNRDLVNRLTDRGKLSPKDLELVRHRAALYDHVRTEASYLRLLERSVSIAKPTVAKLIADIERNAFRRRLGEILVKSGTLTREQDRALLERTRQAMEKDDTAIIDRYRREDFAGIAKPIMPGRRLVPEDFKISTLFRGRETRALVDRAGVEALLEADTAPADAANAPTAFSAQAALKSKDGSPTVEQEPSRPEPPAAPLPEPTRVEPAADPATKAQDAKKAMDRVRKMKAIGDYKIVELLGAGGMGAVFLGQKAGLYEFVAIKVMLDQAASAQERGRFDREIQLTRRVKHENVIGIIDSGATPDGLTFLVVPALTGKELRAHVEKAPTGLEPGVALDLFEQVLEGAQAIHDARIVHRDLKPENVFVLAGGQEVKIMDFGLAKLDEEADKEAGNAATFRSKTGEVVGSPPYIAPESIVCDPVDRRTDIYSLGVMLFEMLTGKRPIEADSPQGYLTAHLVAPPLTLAEARPARAWPPEVEQLLARMMGKTRDERPASCRAIVAELRGGLREKLLRGQAPIPATAVSEPSEPAAVNREFGVKGLLGRLWASANAPL